ncbi:NACHT domain-containing protein [Goodfellowiella coeruleoviolacea]|nr:NACHT domain-containing protein [Goodfellowiella coeruleoviolacea]
MSRRPQLAVVIGSALAVVLALAGLLVATPRIPPATWLSAVTAGFLLLLALVDPWLRRSRAARLSTPARLDAAADALAAALLAHWRAELLARGLTDPAVIRLAWRVLGEDTGPGGALADQPLLGPLDTRSASPGMAVDSGPPIIRATAVARAFERLPSRRLVITGAAGAGKSTLAALLALGLLHRGGKPVPVLLPLAGWDPRREDLRAVLTRRLYEDHPALRNTELHGRYAADLLVQHRLVLPILDDFDELPAELHAEALRRINQAFPASTPLVLTCRSAAYARLAERARPDGVAGAAGAGGVDGASVVELCPVAAEEVVDYLRGTAEPATAAWWEPVFLRVRHEPDGPLARALATPLMLWLASSGHGAGRAKPIELLDRERLPDRAAIEQRLVDAMLAAALPDQAHPGLPEISQLWPRRPALRWLGFLATRLRERGTREFAWWELRHAVSRVWLALLAALALGVLAGLAMAWLVASAGSPTLARVTGLGVGVAVAVGTVSKQNSAHQGRSATPGAGLGRSLVGTSAVLGAVAGLVLGGLYGVVPGLLAGLAVAVGAALHYALASSTRLARPTSPLATLASDRAALWAGCLVGALVLGLASALSFAPRDPGMVGLSIVAGFVLGFAASVLSLRWWWYTVARTWLATRGRLPWQLQTFLDDAHRLGVFTQSGARYQFRHALLRDRLAEGVLTADALATASDPDEEPDGGSDGADADGRAVTGGTALDPAPGRGGQPAGAAGDALDVLGPNGLLGSQGGPDPVGHGNAEP